MQTPTLWLSIRPPMAAAILTSLSFAQGDSPLMQDMEARPGRAPLPVILSTDCGTEIDDQWAVIYLAISPELEVLGFLGNHARNGLSGTQARDTLLDVLENRLDMQEHPPALAGADGPLASRDTPNDNQAVRFLIEQAERFTPTERLNVLVIGSHTDVASAILLDPSIVQRIRVIMMGIDDWPGGGDPWNVRNDPAAARIVFGSGVPLVIAPGEVAKRHLSFTTEECQALLRDTGKAGTWLAECFAAWEHRFEVDGRKIWPIWDNLAVGYLLGFTRTVVHHRPRIAEDLSFDHSDPQGQLTWVGWVDEGRLWRDYVAKLRAWQARPKA
jgi:purine nucleosidase